MYSPCQLGAYSLCGTGEANHVRHEDSSCQVEISAKAEGKYIIPEKDHTENQAH